MAVIPGLPGLEATIEVNDKPLKEYDDPHARQPDEDLELLATSTKETEHVALNAKDIPHVVKYLEVESGTEFSCHFIKHASFHGRCDHLALTFERDLSKSYLSHEPSNDGREWNRVLKYINFRGSNGHARRSMLFEPLNIVSAEHSTLDTLNHDVFRARKLGTLRLLVYEMKHAEANKKDPRTPCRTSTSLHNHVMEKALKGRALDCAVSYGPAEPSDRIVEPENIFEDPLKRPCAVFEFRYRSREGLIQEGILPRPSIIDGMTEEEVRRYALELHQERERSQTIKSEIKNEHIKREDDNKAPGSKRRARDSTDPTPPAKRLKETVLEDGNVGFDLTD